MGILRLFIVFFAASVVSSCAAAEVRTTPTVQSRHILLPPNITGAESLAFDARGQGPYTGVSDGRILKWGGGAGWTTFAHHADYFKNPRCREPRSHPEEMESVCGRPLGLAFHRKSGDLYIADAYKGLMKVGPHGGEAKVLATGADGIPFNFVNGIDIDQATGDVYFTDSSTTYQRRSNIQIMLHRDATGRLLKYDAKTKTVTVLKDKMAYPNGVSISYDRTYIVVAQTGPCQALRYYLQGPKAGKLELFADLPGYPDNVRRDGKGGFWVALNRESVQMNGTAPVKHLVGVRLDSSGVEVEELTAAKGVSLSEVTEMKGRLWLGSVELDYVGLLPSFLSS